MSILLHKDTRVLVQGITGQMGRFSVADMRGYGTTVVAGVVPGRAGSDVDGVPVFSNPRDAIAETGAEASLVYVPPAGIRNAAIEALDQGIRLVVATADEVPVQDVIEIRAAARANGASFVGPNTPGLISPGKAKMGFMPSFCFAQGSIGVISRSGSLSYEVSQRLTRAELGQSTVLGIGGDPVKGTNAAEALALFDADPETQAILYLGEIGGSEEVAVAEYASRNAKPVAALIVGKSAPAGKKMGHAAALINSAAEGHEAKVKMLADSGVSVADGLSEVVNAMKRALKAVKPVKDVA